MAKNSNQICLENTEYQSGGNVDGRMAIYNVTAVIRTILVKGFNCRRSHKLRKLLINENTRTNAQSSKIKLKNRQSEILKCLGHCISCDDDERRNASIQNLVKLHSKYWLSSLRNDVIACNRTKLQYIYFSGEGWWSFGCAERARVSMKSSNS